MTSMSNQHHQALTSWNPTSATAVADYHQLHHHHHHHHQQQQQQHPINMEMGETNNNLHQANQYNQLSNTQRLEHHQHPATTPENSSIVSLTSDTALQSAQQLAPASGSIATAPTNTYMSGVDCRKTSPPIPVSVIKNPVSNRQQQQQQQHHHHHETSYQETSMISGHEIQRHQHMYQQHSQQQQQQQQQQQSQHNQLSTNYYELPNNQECHPDYYMVRHQHVRPIDPFQHHHQPAPASHPVAQVGPQAAISAQCWPNLSQSTSPQIATSPAMMSQFQLGTHQAHQNLPASVSPYANHANYTNGYHPQSHPHYVSQHQPQQQQHAITMHSPLSDDVYSHQHQHHHTSTGPYNQFSTRNQPIINPPGITSSGSTNNAKTQSPMQHLPHIVQHQPSSQTIRHYSASNANNSNNNNNNNKVPTTTSETITLNARATSIGANSSPKLNQQNLLSSPAASINTTGQLCRHQSSSVVSTSSVGSNPSDHHSAMDSPSSVTTQNQTVANLNVDSAANRQGSLEERLSTNETEQDSKESQLSQLHQQCAVILDEQQQHYVAINSPNSNINGTNASNSTINNSSNNNNNTTSNGNNSGRSKRLRTSFKHNQLKEMKRWFNKNQNPDAKDLKTLAQTTGLSKRVLQVWFQNARAKHRRNNAKAANQQLYDVNQHTSHMLQFQHQQQNFHHHHHHHHARPIIDQTMNTQQQAGQHHHLPSQDSATIAHTFVPLSGVHQQVTTGAINLVEQSTTTIHHNIKQDNCD